MPDQDRVDAVDPERCTRRGDPSDPAEYEAYCAELIASMHYTPEQIERVLALMRS